MTTKTGLQALGARFGIEDAHAGHVASLAEDIFDGFSAGHGLRREDRALLLAAAYLHDIGYASDPEDHVEAGVRILLENPLDAFSAKDWAMVAGMVLLHRRDWRPMCEHGLFATMGSGRMERVGMLAAILRIADGLDRGHLQDARITFCRRGKKSDRIGVACGWYAGSLRCAEEKADLWESVFKRRLRMQGTVQRPGKIFGQVVHPKDSAMVAARRILYSQYDVMRDQLPGMREEGSAVDSLHDYRVALRRFRIALKLFAPLVGKTGGCRKLEKKLGKLSDRMGLVRDTHVVWLFFQDPDLSRLVDAAFLATLDSDMAKANQDLVGIVESAEVRRTVLEMNRLLRIELPALERTVEPVGFKQYVGERLAGLMEEIEGFGMPAEDADPEQVHELRKRCRKGRYYAEFAEPAFGKSMAKKARVLNGVASALGDVRDACNLFEKLQAAGCDARLLDRVALRRRDGWDRFTADWHRLTGY